MPVRCLVSSKTVHEAERGELIGLSNDDGTVDWALVIDHNDSHTTGLALLASADEHFSKPVAINFSSEEPCLSWGTEWVFEPLVLSGPFSTNLRDEPGSWIIQDTDVGLRLAGDLRGGTRAYTLDLRTFGPLNITRGYAVGGLSWRIWASAEEMVDPRGRPLFVMNTKENAAAQPGQDAQ